jgi:thioesterase domain-containing protein/acyl carrier protein
MVRGRSLELARLKMEGLGPSKRDDARTESRPGGRLNQPRVWPCDVTEARLLSLWEGLFDDKLIGVHDDFFDLGGNSIVAIRLASRIEEEFGLSVSPTILFEAPTIASLGEVLRTAATSSSSSCLVRVSDGKPSRAPFIVLHAVTGDVLHLGILRRALDRTTYAVRSVGLDEGAEPLTTIPKMAEAYLRQLEDVRPSGPYLLAGYSIGAPIAYEMAQQLVSRGRDVSFLGLIAGTPPVSLREARKMSLEDLMFERLNEIVMKYLRIDGYVSAQVQQDLSAVAKTWAWSDVVRMVQHLKSVGYLPSDLTEKHLLRRLEIYAKNMRAAAEYRLEPYSGPVTFFEAVDESLARIWRQSVSDITVIPLGGEHKELFVDNPVLPRELRRLLDEADPN